MSVLRKDLSLFLYGMADLTLISVFLMLTGTLMDFVLFKKSPRNYHQTLRQQLYRVGTIMWVMCLFSSILNLIYSIASFLTHPSLLSSLGLLALLYFPLRASSSLKLSHEQSESLAFYLGCFQWTLSLLFSIVTTFTNVEANLKLYPRELSAGILLYVLLFFFAFQLFIDMCVAEMKALRFETNKESNDRGFDHWFAFTTWLCSSIVFLPNLANSEQFARVLGLLITFGSVHCLVEFSNVSSNLKRLLFFLGAGILLVSASFLHGLRLLREIPLDQVGEKAKYEGLIVFSSYCSAIEIKFVFEVLSLDWGLGEDDPEEFDLKEIDLENGKTKLFFQDFEST